MTRQIVTPEAPRYVAAKGDWQYAGKPVYPGQVLVPAGLVGDARVFFDTSNRYPAGALTVGPLLPGHVTVDCARCDRHFADQQRLTAHVRECPGPDEDADAAMVSTFSEAQRQAEGALNDAKGHLATVEATYLARQMDLETHRQLALELDGFDVRACVVWASKLAGLETSLRRLAATRNAATGAVARAKEERHRLHHRN